MVGLHLPRLRSCWTCSGWWGCGLFVPLLVAAATLFAATQVAAAGGSGATGGRIHRRPSLSRRTATAITASWWPTGTSLEGDLAALRTTLAGRGEDGYLMRTVGERLVLTGNSPRATLYAVYHFLEKYLGCGWCVPGEDTVPKHNVVQVAALDEAVGPPAFSMRQIIVYPCGEARITVRGPTCIYAEQGPWMALQP